MDTARYRAFITAAETGSIRMAAEALGYTSSGISQLIHALEEELQLTLFFRGKKGVTLTAAGETVLPVIRRLVAQENTLLQVSADLNGKIYGTINLASYHSLASAWMPELIGAFQKDFPQVRINLYEGTQKDIVQRLQEGKADLAFFNNSTMTGRYDWIPLQEDPMLAVVPDTHAMAGAVCFPVEKFAGERFIMTEHGFDYDVVEILGQHGIVPDVYLSTFDSYILLDMVERGLGISMINQASLWRCGEERRLRAIPIEPKYSLQMGIAALSLETASPAVRKFAEYAVKRLKTDI
ncbi:MAG: LysR family transcriptional regulator [Eubacteriales bacterium]|nr:LysR family transcriptional regulator [Eubacteriales bacterium]